MSATMARQGGWVQLEQSDMRLALNMAKMAKWGFSSAAIEETQQLIKKPRAEVREAKKRGVEFAGHNKLKAAIERHPAMVRENQTDGCLPCPNSTANNPQTRWRSKGQGAPPPRPVPPWPESPPVPSDDKECSEMEGMPPAFLYIHTPLPNGRFLPRIACPVKISFQICWLMMVQSQVSTLSAQWYCSWQPFWWWGQPFEWIWQRRRDLTEGNRNFEYFHYLQLADTLKYILKGIFLCIIKEQCSNRGECTWIAQNGCQKTIIDILCQSEWF